MKEVSTLGKQILSISWVWRDSTRDTKQEKRMPPSLRNFFLAVSLSWVLT